MGHVLHYIDILIATYLTGLVLTAIFYIPFKVSKRKVQGFWLGLTVLGCFFWPLVLPLSALWIGLRRWVVTPIHNFYEKTTPEDDRITIPEDERATIPFEVDSKFIKGLTSASESNSRIKLRR